MYSTILAIVAVLACSNAGHLPAGYEGYAGVPSNYEGSSHNQLINEHVNYYAPPKYEYKYSVEDPHTSDYKSHHEVRDGDVVKGEYSLLDADGTYRRVQYTVDKYSGFNAIVTRNGHPVHPVHPEGHAGEDVHHGGGAYNVPVYSGNSIATGAGVQYEQQHH